MTSSKYRDNDAALTSPPRLVSDGRTGKSHVRLGALALLVALGVLMNFQYGLALRQHGVHNEEDNTMGQHRRHELLNHRLDALEQADEDWKQEVFLLRSELQTLKEAIAAAVAQGENGAPVVQQQQQAEASVESNDDTSTDTDAASSGYAAFPKTKFTLHVNELLQVIEHQTLHNPDNNTKSPLPFDPHRFCTSGYRIFVDEPYTPPSAIECNPDNVWCKYFQRLFGHNPTLVLPYNVSVGMSNTDMIKTSSMAWGQCFGSSAPGGLFSMNNFQDAKAQVMMQKNLPNVTGYLHHHARSWEERHTIPVFRGHPRFIIRNMWRNNPEKFCTSLTVANGDFGHRPLAALFSLKHPDLLNARVGKQWGIPCMMYNATNGLDQVFGLGNYSHNNNDTKIPSSEYYTEYQVVVVLGGIGAAFRTSNHLSAGQAVILQRFTYEEWYIPYMTPYEHYIPLKNDMSDLQQVLEWVQNNPKRVKAIADNGKRFYEEWLSFPQTDQHWHEVLWRLSELFHREGTERLKMGVVRTIWPNPIVPTRFIRRASTGLFVPEERSQTRLPYLDYDSPRGDITNE